MTAKTWDWRNTNQKVQNSVPRFGLGIWAKIGVTKKEKLKTYARVIFSYKPLSPDAPNRAITLNFCMRGDVADVITRFKFCVNLFRGFGVLTPQFCKNSPSGRTTLSGCIFASEARIDNGKKLVKQQYLLHMFPQYGDLRPTSGWDRSGSLGHPS